MTRYSLAEIEAQGRKAARGAGYTWGLAEEAGRAIRWLEARGLPGARALAGLLEAQDGCDYAALRPGDLNGLWRADGGLLCPLIAGVTLADHAPFDVPPMIGPIRYPLLILPFAAQCGYSISGALETMDAAETLTLEPGAENGTESPRSRAVASEIWSVLDRFAHRTYVPATNVSRAGAGAGTTDND